MGVPPGVWVRPTGVREGLKDIERLPDTNAAAGITNFWTGGRGESSRFLGAWKCERSRVLPSGDFDKGEDTVEGILLASARGLDIRSRDCKMRRAVALVTPQGGAPAGLALICRRNGAW